MYRFVCVKLVDARTVTTINTGKTKPKSLDRNIFARLALNWFSVVFEGNTVAPSNFLSPDNRGGLDCIGVLVVGVGNKRPIVPRTTVSIMFTFVRFK